MPVPRSNVLFIAYLSFNCFNFGACSEKPPVFKKAETARWIAHNNIWGTLSTTSVHLNGQAWGQPKSFVDGSTANSTGNLYFYDSDLDTSIEDTKADSRVAFSLSMAEMGLCNVEKLDPEDPRCARVVFSGYFVPVEDGGELEFATQALYERHPAMESWPTDHNWKVNKINMTEIWLIDIYGGATIVDIYDYFDVNLNSLRM